MGQILVAVETDLGLRGYGVGGGGLAGLHVVRTVLRDLLIGRSPEKVESLWAEMYAASMPFGQKGLAIMALSGLDLALWDLRGKLQRKPVAELLGGRVGEPIPTYVTVWDDIPPESAESHRAFKLHIPPVDPAIRVADVLERVQRRAGGHRVRAGSDDRLLDGLGFGKHRCRCERVGAFSSALD